jgi:hypothetical protein
VDRQRPAQVDRGPGFDPAGERLHRRGAYALRSPVTRGAPTLRRANYDRTDAAERIRALGDADEARWVERQVEIDADIRAAYAARLELE